MGDTTLGITIMLISTTIMNIGTVLQKKAVDSLPTMEEQKVSDNVKGVVGNKLWLVGWVMTTLAIVLQSIALGQADMTIIQPLIAFGLVVLVIFSHYYLGEKIRKNEVIGILLAIVGVIYLGLKAQSSRVFVDTEEVLSNYTHQGFAIALVIFIVIIAALWFITKKINYRDEGILYSLIAGMFSVLGLSFSKGIFSIVDLIGIGNALAIWQVYILLVIWITNSTMAIVTQQLSLQRGKSIIVTPVFNLSSIIFPLITGYLIFSENIGIEKIISTIIIIIGAILLSMGREEANADSSKPAQEN